METESTIIRMLRSSEDRIGDYCEELHDKCIELSELDDEIEQLIYDNRLLCNIVNTIGNRVAMVRSGYSDSEIALGEIESILKEVDQ